MQFPSPISFTPILSSSLSTKTKPIQFLQQQQQKQYIHLPFPPPPEQMGCCASTNAKGAPPINRHVEISKSPPASASEEEEEEEEAVKEVLSEKPISPNPYYYNLNSSVPKLTDNTNSYLSMTSAIDSVHKSYLQSPRKQIEEISDGRNRVPRSPSPGRVNGDPGSRRERLAGKSPVKRPDPSPRRSGSGREVQRRREPGENSGRRSGSPVTRNVGRSSSGRKNGLSPGKIRMVQPGSGPGGGFDGGRRDSWETDPTAPNESLENPLVSLECFIFL